jgi:hypothetical protein
LLKEFKFGLVFDIMVAATVPVAVACTAMDKLSGRTMACVPIPPRKVAVPDALVQRSLTV